MAILCTIDSNDSFRLSGLSKKEASIVKKTCSYKVAGSNFVKSAWDGTVRLFSAVDESTLKIKIGLLGIVLATLRRSAIEVADLRKVPPKVAVSLLNEISARPHQARSVDAVSRPGPLYGIGTIKAPIRSGKTITAALLIERFKVRALFVVPSKHLAIQSREVLCRVLQTHVGLIGLGERSVGEIVTVATAQSLSSLESAERKKLRGVFGLVIVDEVHHMTGKEWNKGIASLSPRYRIGLSATAYFGATSEIERGILQALALCGDVVVDVPIDEMIRAGYLVAPKIFLHEVKSPKWRGRYSPAMLEACIVKNDGRNSSIAALAKRHFDAGQRVLVIARLLDHIEELACYLRALGVPVETCIGETKDRKRIVASLLNAEKVVISNVLGEGVDLPELEVVIIAGGGSDPKDTMQRLRCLTACEGKVEAIVHDFFDNTSRYLAAHSEQRFAVYREHGFDVTEDFKRCTPQPCPF